MGTNQRNTGVRKYRKGHLKREINKEINNEIHKKGKTDITNELNTYRKKHKRRNTQDGNKHIEITTPKEVTN